MAVIPTDTLYGIVASAFDKKAVERIYKIKSRNKAKAPIILISSINDLKKFYVSNLPIRTNKRMVDESWPGKVSIIFPLGAMGKKKFKYLHRGLGSLAFRLPKKKSLLDLLKKAGPLIAPSANPEGLLPVATIKEAKKYFGNKIDIYIHGRKLSGKPSKLISIDKSGRVQVLRK